MKRLLILLFCALTSSSAFGANDVIISVRINYSNYRIEPKPELKKSFFQFRFLLHPDGTIEETSSSPGRFGSTRESDQKLGKRFRVVDENTIERKFESEYFVRALTVKVKANRAMPR